MDIASQTPTAHRTLSADLVDVTGMCVPVKWITCPAWTKKSVSGVGVYVVSLHYTSQCIHGVYQIIINEKQKVPGT